MIDNCTSHTAPFPGLSKKRKNKCYLNCIRLLFRSNLDLILSVGGVFDELNSYIFLLSDSQSKISTSKSPEQESKENKNMKLSSPVKSAKKSKTTTSKPVLKRKHSLENPLFDQPYEKRTKADESSTQRKLCDKVKVKLESNSATENQNKRVSTGSDVTSSKPDMKSPISDQNKNVKTKKLLKNVDPNQKTILQYFLSQSNPV